MFNEFRFAPALIIALAACTSDADLLEEPVLEAEIADSVETIAPSPTVTGRVRAGVLTAGDIDDGLNLPAFQKMAAEVAQTLDLPNPGGGQTLELTLVGPDRLPAPGVRVTLRRPGADTPFHETYTGVGGRLTVFPDVLDQGRLGEVELRAFGPVGRQMTATVRPGRRNVLELPFDNDWSPGFLDLAFAVDTTGSMADELDWLERDLIRIVDQARRIRPGVRIRFGLVTYRDQGDDYVVRNYGFTDEARVMRGWVRGEEAEGGGDYPEAAAQALSTAVSLDWRRGKGERLLFHIADAPPHRRDAARYLGAASKAARNNIQIFGLGASGVADEAEYLMRQASLVTGGRYLFLTDDSRVGYGHAEPTVSCYRVTSLSGLMRRVLMSELSGRRYEAEPQNVIREVGTYRAGRCIN